MSAKRLNFRRSRLRRAGTKGRDETKAQIGRIDALTAAGRANWLALLAYLAFALVTTLGVEDIDFFVDSRQTRLPIVGVSIPTFSFFVFAPILGAALYTYLHLHIRKVTEVLSEAPPGPPLIEEQIKPWLLNDFVLRQRRDDAIRRRPLDWIANIATLGLVWLAAPLVLALMWWRTWPAHTLWLTTLCGAAVIATIYVGLQSWAKMRRETGRKTHYLPVLAVTAALAALILGRGFTATSGIVPPVMNQTLPISVLQYGMVARADLRGVTVAELPLDSRDHVSAHLSYRRQWCALRAIPETECRTLSTADALPPRFDVAAFRSCAEKRDLAGCFRTSAPPDMSLIEEWQAFRKAEIEALARSDLSRRDLSDARLRAASLVGLDIYSTDLRNAELIFTRMEQADLRSSDLSSARFHSADLRGAFFFFARLDRTRLDGALLQGAEFNDATGESTGFNRARLESSRLGEVEFPRATFSNARLDHAYMYGAKLPGARFIDASLAYVFAPRADFADSKFQNTDLTGANLAFARFDKALLRRTRFIGSILDDATFGGARFDETMLRATVTRGADFRGAEELLQSQLDTVVGDARTLLPDRPDVATGEQLFVLSCLPREWEAWEHLAPAIWQRVDADYAKAAERLETILCAPGETPHKTGTPWEIDAPPPWNVDPDWRPEHRGLVSREGSR